MNTDDDVRYQVLTCAKCGFTHECTPAFDYFKTDLWSGAGRVCEICFHQLVLDEFKRVAKEKINKI